MKLKLIVASLGTLLLLGAASGCGSDDEGTLQQNWTIQGGTSADACSVAGAAQMRVVIVDGNGFTQATNFESCSSFTSRIALDEDTYTGAATFVGTDGLPVSQTKIIPAFRIIKGETTVQTVDFNIGDFLAR